MTRRTTIALLSLLAVGHVGGAVPLQLKKNKSGPVELSDDDLVYRKDPQYPLNSQRQRHQGAGIFELRVDLASGRIVSVEAVKSTGFRELDAEVVKAVKTWQFRPRGSGIATGRMPATFKLNRRDSGYDYEGFQKMPYMRQTPPRQPRR